jgi:exonuclease SbcC
MRIKELFIRRYGPLRDKTYTLCDRFNLFHGKNEDGKTLTIDALVKLLLGRNIKNFRLIDRVEENPEGYVIVEDDEGREIKLPEKGTLSTVVDLTPSECRNIFIIRNSDLAIPHEGEFYMDVTDRLLGLRTEEIFKIKEALRDMGRITPGGMFRDVKGEKLKTRIENAEALMEQTADLIEETREEKYEGLEEEAVCHRDKLDDVNQRLAELEEARKREQYEKGERACRGLRDALGELATMRAYNAESERLWRECNRDLMRLEGEKRGLEKEIEREKAELKSVEAGLDERTRAFQILEETKGRVDNEIRQELAYYRSRCEKLVARSKTIDIVSKTWRICTLLFIVSLLGIIVKQSMLFLVLAGSFLACALVLWIIKFRFVRYGATLASDFERIRLRLSSFELSAQTIEGILANIQRFDLEYRGASDQLQDLRRRKETGEARIDELVVGRTRDIDEKMREAEDRIDGIRQESKEGSLEGYTEGFIKKQQLEKLLGEYESILTSHFGVVHEDLEENLAHWEKQIAALDGYRERSTGIQYSEDGVAELVKEKQNLEGRLENIEGQMDIFQRKMTEIERKANNLLRLDKEHLHCKTLVDLEGVRQRLGAFLDGNETNRSNALRATRIFEDIEREEKERVSDLFDSESPLSDYFNDITGGLYEEVTFNQAIGKMEVKREDRVTLSPEKLSGGAYDQLYLTVRLALGERLLRGKPGFFIMDDPFIKADSHRLVRQVDVLKRVSSLGWQIMYFSAKEEIMEVLRKDVERGVVKGIEIQSIFS